MEHGASRNGMRNEDLEQLTFADASFDLFITQDVFEHIFDASAAFREIARVLRPGGAHVFTVPYWPDRSTRVRAVRTESEIEHLRKPIHHDDPIDPTGALVVRDWGNDLTDFINDASGLDTQMFEPNDRRKVAGRLFAGVRHEEVILLTGDLATTTALVRLRAGCHHAALKGMHQCRDPAVSVGPFFPILRGVLV
jgi:SAM-dependent methyltransferase